MSGVVSLGERADARATAGRLVAAGLTEESAGRKAELFAKAAQRLLKDGLPAGAAALAYFVPGRIEVLGKHTDYAGGRSVVAAADRGFCLVAVPADDAKLRMTDVEWNERVEFAIDGELSPRVGHWSNYPQTAARRLARNFPGPLRGAHVAFGSDLPSASGMSSSSAMLIASYRVLSGVNGLEGREEYRRNIDGKEALAGYLATMENGQSFGTLAGDRGVGTFGGSEDHTAILCGRAGSMSQYSYCPVRFERLLPVPPGCVFAIAASGVLAEKTGEAMEKYNRASRLARAAAAAWRSASGRDDTTLAAAVASCGGEAEEVRRALAKAKCEGFGPAELSARFEQFFQESERIIPAAGEALLAGRVEEFERWVDRSQEEAERLLGNQVPETILLARSARECGAAAASAFGAGFGGSVWALVGSAGAERFLATWRQAYREKFPKSAARSRFFLTGAGPAAFQLD